MRNRTLVLLALLAVVLSAAWAPLEETKWDLLVHNNTEEPVQITLEGEEKTYIFTVDPGKIAKTVIEGEYEYSYKACDVKEEGTITVDQERVWLIIEKCLPEPVYTKFVVYYQIAEPISVEMIGPEEYSLNIEIGKNKFIDILAGDYFYSYDACDTTFSGTVKVTKNGKSYLLIKTCESLARQDLVLPNPVKMRIANRFSVSVDITLIGPKTYFFSASPGMNSFEVLSGSYTYVFAAHGVRYEGAFVVQKNGLTVVPIPGSLALGLE